MLLPEYDGRVIITWPAASGGRIHGWGVTVHDADTGEQITDATSVLTVAHGSPDSWDSGALVATLTRLVDADGKPIGADSGKFAATDEYNAWFRTAGPGDVFSGQKFRTGTFRYLVIEMRTADDPMVPTVRSVAEGRHTIDEYQERLWQLQREAWELAGIKPKLGFHPDPDAVLMIGCPDEWTPEQVQEFSNMLSAHLPDQRIVMMPDSVHGSLEPAETDA